MGISVEVPDINRSESDFTPVVETDEAGEPSLSIIFGLSAVRNVGEGLVAHIVAEREAGGPYADFYDFCQRVDTQVLNKRTVESLIKAGAFDDVGHPRKGLLTVFEQIVDHTVARRRERDMGIMTLFGGGDDGGPGDDFERTAIPDLEFDKRDRLAFEKEMLGLYVSDHPLLGAEATLSAEGRRRHRRARLVRRRGHEVDRRRHHRPAAQVDPQGRPDGRVRPRGPALVGRGDGVPPHDAGAGPQAGRRRRGHREGPGRQA